MTRDETQAVIDAFAAEAKRLNDAAGMPHRPLLAASMLDGEADGLTKAARMLAEALAKSEAAPSVLDRVIATAEETARLKSEAAESERHRADCNRNVVERFHGEACGIDYVVRLLRAHCEVQS